MKTKFLSVIFSLLILSPAFAQEEMFKVLASKGANKVIAANAAEQKVLIGKKLYKDDKIVIGENSYLGLAHKNGKTIELKKAGTYEINKLSSEVASQNAGVAKKYVEFVAGEMTSTNENMAKDRHKYMAVNGAVERPVPAEIKVLSPINSYALASQVTLRWIPLKDTAATYVITLTDLGDETVYTTETRSNFVVVDLGKLNFKDEKNFIWKVTKKDPKKKLESEPCILKYVEEDRAEALEKQAADMKAELSEETALNKLVLASFYEEQGLILDALTNYEAATKLEPTVEDYQVAYGKFLDRNNLVKADK